LTKKKYEKTLRLPFDRLRAGFSGGQRRISIIPNMITLMYKF